MEFRFAERMLSLKPSMIREILKMEPDPESISFAAGNPSPLTFEVDKMAAAAADIFKNNPADAFQYGITEGYGPLIKTTAERIKRKYNIGAAYDTVTIVSGGQQGIELLAKVMLNEGEVVFCESPSFIGALNTFRVCGAKLVGIPIDKDGMVVDELEKAILANPNGKIIYTIPAFHNPCGSTLSLERRHKMLALAEKYDLIILEDSPYFELRYSGEDLPTLKSLDKTGRVLFCGSYSKVVAPGLRIGFVCGHENLVAKMTVAKQGEDVHTNLFFQMVINSLLNSGSFDEHVADNIALYTKKRDRMLSKMDECLTGKAKWNVPDGGLFIWLELPNGIDGLEFCERLKKDKLACVPGCAFSVDESEKVCAIRLNFSLPSDEQIDRGIAIIGKVLEEYI